MEHANGKHALLVMGYSGADTRLTAKVLAQRYVELTGTEVLVEGTTLSGACINDVCPPTVCGDTICDYPSESLVSCPSDCATPMITTIGGYWQLPETALQAEAITSFAHQLSFVQEGDIWKGKTLCSQKEECDEGSLLCFDATGKEGRKECSDDCSGYGLCEVTGVCGDGVRNDDLGEICDDGNLITETSDECGYGNHCCKADCSGSISGPQCNDGEIQNPPEECDPEYAPSLFMSKDVTLPDGSTRQEIQGCLGRYGYIGQRYRNSYKGSDSGYGLGCDKNADGACDFCSYGTWGYCGDGIAQDELEEWCDDGNTVTENPEQCGYGENCCSEDCKENIGGGYCGDNIVQGSCSDVRYQTYAECTATEAVANGAVWTGEEQCEDFGPTRFLECSVSGAKIQCDSYTCTYPTACPTGYCGDGTTQLWETCDDGNVVNETPEQMEYAKAHCNDLCTEQLLGGYCTDRVVQSPDEACEVSGETEWKVCTSAEGTGKQQCKPDCSAYQNECLICGDGIKHPWEYCDDGNTVEETAAECGYGKTCCKADCSFVISGLQCGDGILQRENGEVCDPGDSDDPNDPADVSSQKRTCPAGDVSCPAGSVQSCLSDCSGYSEWAVCGNGKVQKGEYCDDGNTNEETAEQCGYENTCCKADCSFIVSGSECGDDSLDYFCSLSSYVVEGECTAAGGAWVKEVCDYIWTDEGQPAPEGAYLQEQDAGNGQKEYRICNSACSGYGDWLSGGVCGDSVTQWWAGEFCDDGNTVDEEYTERYGYACSADCQNEISSVASCWDGEVQPEFGEVCDPAGSSEKRIMVGLVTDEPPADCSAEETITLNTRQQVCSFDCSGYQWSYWDYPYRTSDSCLFVANGDLTSTLGDGRVDPWEVCDDGNRVTETPEECGAGVCCSADGQHFITGISPSGGICGDGIIQEQRGVEVFSLQEKADSANVFEGSFRGAKIPGTQNGIVTIGGALVHLNDDAFTLDVSNLDPLGVTENYLASLNQATWQRVDPMDVACPFDRDGDGLPDCPTGDKKVRYLCQVGKTVEAYKIATEKAPAAREFVASLIRFTRELFA